MGVGPATVGVESPVVDGQGATEQEEPATPAPAAAVHAKDLLCNHGVFSKDFPTWIKQNGGPCGCGGSCEAARKHFGFPDDLPLIDFSCNKYSTTNPMNEKLVVWASGRFPDFNEQCNRCASRSCSLCRVHLLTQYHPDLQGVGGTGGEAPAPGGCWCNCACSWRTGGGSTVPLHVVYLTTHRVSRKAVHMVHWRAQQLPGWPWLRTARRMTATQVEVQL